MEVLAHQTVELLTRAVCYVAVVYWIVRPILEAGADLLKRKTTDPVSADELKLLSSRVDDCLRLVREVDRKTNRRPESISPPPFVESR